MPDQIGTQADFLSHISYGYGSYTGETGKTTIEFPHADRVVYILFAGDSILIAYVAGNLTCTVKDTQGNSKTVTVISAYKFQIAGFAWYLTPKYFGIL